MSVKKMDRTYKIEFGEVDLKLRQTYINDDCVELPTSWPKRDAVATGKISFGFCDDFTHDISENSPNVGKELTDINSNLPNGGCNAYNGEYEKECRQMKDSSAKSDSVKKTMQVDENPTLNVAEVQQVISTEPATKVKIDSNFQTGNSKDEITNLNIIDDVHENGVVPLNWAEEPFEEKSVGKNVPVINDSKSVRTTQNTDTNLVEKGKNNEVEKRNDKANDVAAARPSSSWAGLFRGKASDTGPKTSLTNGSTSTAASSKKDTVNPGEKEILVPAKVVNHTKNNNQPQNNQQQNNQPQNSQPQNSQPQNNQQQNNQQQRESVEVKHVGVAEDDSARMLAEKLHSLDLIYKPQAFIPRGLVNISNWCFINATLQALLVCPPLFQLLKILPTIPANKRKTSTPILDSFVRLASEFRPLSSKKGFQSSKEVRQGYPFEPTYIYDMLTTIKSPLSQIGRQEDAEEFQTCILNGLHEEMAQLLNISKSSPIENQQKNGNLDYDSQLPYEVPVYDDVSNGNSDDVAIEDEWEEVVATKKNRSAVTRRADITKTPISEMFRGELCTSVFRPGQKVSVSMEPFFSLQLDVLPDHPWSIDEALLSLTEKEFFYAGESDNNDASRQQTLEVLPPILILHLKRFVYDKNGGLRKIDKRMEYKTELVINKDLLSKSSRKLSLTQRSYKLFAVLYHHGDKATGGHYSTDVFHIGVSSWLRIDDQSIRPVTNSEVTRHSSIRTAYLLYYRRTDLG